MGGSCEAGDAVDFALSVIAGPSCVDVDVDVGVRLERACLVVDRQRPASVNGHFAQTHPIVTGLHGVGLDHAEGFRLGQDAPTERRPDDVSNWS